MIPQRRHLIFFRILCLIVLLSGCGLPVFITLNMPGFVSFSTVDGEFVFSADKDINNETEFRGFELYYHIYAPGAVPDSANDHLSLDALLANGFKRISRASAPQESRNALDRPLITSVDPLLTPPFDDLRVFDYTVTAAFSGLADAIQPDVAQVDPGEPTVTVSIDPPGTLVIRRGVFYTETGSTDIFKRFNEIANGDGDITPDIYTALASGAPVPLVLYALSYGVNLEEGFTPVYSVPLYLGEIDVLFPTVP
jgi:hypothetical protein